MNFETIFDKNASYPSSYTIDDSKADLNQANGQSNENILYNQNFYEQIYENISKATTGEEILLQCEKLPHTNAKTGRSITYIRILKVLKRHGLLPNDFNIRYSALGKKDKDVFFEALYNCDGDPNILMSIKSAAIYGFPKNSQTNIVLDLKSENYVLNKVALLAHLLIDIRTQDLLQHLFDLLMREYFCGTIPNPLIKSRSPYQDLIQYPNPSSQSMNIASITSNATKNQKWPPTVNGAYLLLYQLIDTFKNDYRNNFDRQLLSDEAYNSIKHIDPSLGEFKDEYELQSYQNRFIKLYAELCNNLYDHESSLGHRLTDTDRRHQIFNVYIGSKGPLKNLGLFYCYLCWDYRKVNAPPLYMIPTKTEISSNTELGIYGDCILDQDIMSFERRSDSLNEKSTDKRFLHDRYLDRYISKPFNEKPVITNDKHSERSHQQHQRYDRQFELSSKLSEYSQFDQLIDNELSHSNAFMMEKIAKKRKRSTSLDNLKLNPRMMSSNMLQNGVNIPQSSVSSEPTLHSTYGMNQSHILSSNPIQKPSSVLDSYPQPSHHSIDLQQRFLMEKIKTEEICRFITIIESDSFHKLSVTLQHRVLMKYENLLGILVDYGDNINTNGNVTPIGIDMESDLTASDPVVTQTDIKSTSLQVTDLNSIMNLTTRSGVE
jgi:hypothetical protein